jgi:hypothetical protein
MTDNNPLMESGAGRFATARKGGIDADEIAFIQAKARSGLTATQIAKQIGRPVLDVAPWMRAPPQKACMEPRPDNPPPPPGPSQPMVMLSLWRGLIKVNPPRSTMEEIAREVADRYRVPLADIRGHGRAQGFVIPRQEAMWRMYESRQWSNQQIGNYFSGRDHTTVIHARKAHLKRVAEVVAYQATIDDEPSADLRAWRTLGGIAA